MDWDKLRVFHTVAEAGSFTHAGELLNLSQSSISRQIGALERSLKVVLFRRHARGLTLTEQGEALYGTAREVVAKLAMAEALVSESQDRPKGPLRVVTPVGFGSMWLTERLNEFIDLYPEVEVTLMVANHDLDLLTGQADIAIRMSPPRQPELVYRRLRTMRHKAFASAGYIERFGEPKTLEDLDHHRLLAYDDTLLPPLTDINWLLRAGANGGKDRHPILRINNVYGLYRAAAMGIGIASLPDYMAIVTRSLVPILGAYRGPAFTTFLVYPQELRQSRRIIVFRDFLLRKMAENVDV